MSNRMPKRLSNATSIDFYRSWMIEVNHTQTGYYYVCCSPGGQQLSDEKLYPKELDAQQAAVALIDRAFACYALKRLLREFYEHEQLSLADWLALSQSLNYVTPV